MGEDKNMVSMRLRIDKKLTVAQLQGWLAGTKGGWLGLSCFGDVGGLNGAFVATPSYWF
jgi:hypothetical protein